MNFILAGYKQAFRVYDKDNNGYIDFEEMRKAIYTCTSELPDEAEVRSCMTEWDIDSK